MWCKDKGGILMLHTYVFSHLPQKLDDCCYIVWHWYRNYLCSTFGGCIFWIMKNFGRMSRKQRPVALLIVLSVCSEPRCIKGSLLRQEWGGLLDIGRLPSKKFVESPAISLSFMPDCEILVFLCAPCPVLKTLLYDGSWFANLQWQSVMGCNLHSCPPQ